MYFLQSKTDNVIQFNAKRTCTKCIGLYIISQNVHNKFLVKYLKTQILSVHFGTDAE